MDNTNNPHNQLRPLPNDQVITRRGEWLEIENVEFDFDDPDLPIHIFFKNPLSPIARPGDSSWYGAGWYGYDGREDTGRDQKSDVTELYDPRGKLKWKAEDYVEPTKK